MPLATGGMAQVWVAKQTGELGFSRIVALKTIRPDLAEDESFRRMFLEEARMASRIRHANVVEVLDLGEEGPILFQAMPLIEGDSMTGLMRRWHRQGNAGGLPVPIVVRIVADAATGLHAAHTLSDEDGIALELVHRDVSPHNILVALDGSAKIADFGIAKALGRMVDETEPGQIKGKFAYLAPEQVARKPLDRRADVFALGIVLWEALTGKRLFRGEDAMDTVQKVLHMEIPDPRVLSPGIPPMVAQIALRALERDADKRFWTASELADALDAAARHAGVAASTKDVAALVKVLAGADLEAQRVTVRELARGGGSNPTPSLPRSPPGAEPTGATTFATTDRRTSLVAPPRKPRALLAVLGVAGAVIAFGAMAIFAMGPREKAPAQPASAASVEREAPSAIEPAGVAPAASATVSASATASLPPAPKTRTAPPPTPPVTPRPKFGNPYGR